MGREENYGSGTFDWTRLLGEDVARTVDEERNGVLYQEVMVQKEGVLKPLYQLFDLVAERVDWEDMQGEFCGFYGWFFSVALSYAETFFPRLKDVCEDVRGILLRNVYEAVKLVPVRCLIREIHCLKERGELAGASPREEYRFYDECMLGDIAYVKEICQKYPELLRLMLVKIDWTVRELAHIVEAVEADGEEIRELFCAGHPFFKVRRITCAFSDTHRGGRTVAEVVLDNGICIFYKPRSLQKENEYQRAYEWLGNKLGIETYHAKMVCREEYGWEERIEREACDSVAAVGRYFYRLGMQLCLCYLVNGSDLHGENIMAKGEFPVIVDMETCLGNRRRGGETVWEAAAEAMGEGTTKTECMREGRFTENEKERQGILNDFLRDGVSRTGILPIPVWGGRGASASSGMERGASANGGGQNGASANGKTAGEVNVSALHKAGKITAPFRLPVIEHAGTSDIAVSYRKGELELPDSLPHLQGKPVDAAGYRRELVAGFVDAYRLVLENKREAEAFLRPLWQSGSRYVARHTQQYSMYLFTSLHPDFMKNTKERIYFLHVLRKAGAGLPPDGEGRELFWQELRDMINMDIPYFSCKGDSLSLAASDGTEIPRFFAVSALEEGKRKFERLGEADLQRQMMLISYSLLMLGEGDDVHMGGESGTAGKSKAIEAGCKGEMPGAAYAAGKFGTVGKSKAIEAGCKGEMPGAAYMAGAKEARFVTEEQKWAAVRGIVRTIFRLRLDGSETCGDVWPDLQFYGGGGWGVRPLGMNLYDGLPGLALFFAALSEKMPDLVDVVARENYERVFLQLCGQMFEHTDSRGKTDGKRAEKNDGMGLFVGESSLWFAYLLLWEMKKDFRFLEYARKQERVVREHRDVTNEVDLLAGDAGCILCYLKMYDCMARYEEMKDCPDKHRYLEMAVEIGERLWERVEPQKSGCGWTIRGESVPLAGMAHGNSGGIYAYAALLERTGNSVYVGRIRKLAEYEDSLYFDALGNWKDVRKQRADAGKGRNMVAWCHGAAGILLSRLKLDSLPEFAGDTFVKQDLEHAVAALKYGEIPDNICLCHGLAGNYLIIKWYLQKYSDKELEERGEVLLRLLICQLEDDARAAAQERNRVGLMCGLAGAGMALWLSAISP